MPLLLGVCEGIDISEGIDIKGCGCPAGGIWKVEKSRNICDWRFIAVAEGGINEGWL